MTVTELLSTVESHIESRDKSSRSIVSRISICGTESSTNKHFDFAVTEIQRRFVCVPCWHPSGALIHIEDANEAAWSASCSSFVFFIIRQRRESDALLSTVCSSVFGWCTSSGRHGQGRTSRHAHILLNKQQQQAGAATSAQMQLVVFGGRFT